MVGPPEPLTERRLRRFPTAPAHARDTLPVYALIFTAGMVQSALAPLGPVYAADLHLTRVQVGALFAVASVSMVLVAFPIGFVTDRLGARRLTVGAAALVALSAFGQGLAHQFWLLLASRAAFGVAFGAVWTAGLAFLSDGAPLERRSSRLGATIPVTGTASSIGPAFAGILAGQFGLAVPFLAIAAAAAAIAVALSVSPTVPAPEREQRLPVARVLRAARGNRRVLGSVAIMVVAGLSGSLSFLLVPLRLKADGVSLAAIGTILGASAVLYIAASMGVTRLGPGAARPAAAGVTAAALGLALALPALSTAVVALTVFLLARAACNAAMSTIAYPLATAGAEEAGIGTGAAIGLVNAAWATSTVIAPLAGAAIAQAAGDRAAFAVLVPITLATGAWLVAVDRPIRRRRLPA